MVGSNTDWLTDWLTSSIEWLVHWFIHWYINYSCINYWNSELANDNVSMVTQGFSWGGGGQVVWLPQVADSKRQQNKYFRWKTFMCSTNFNILNQIKGNLLNVIIKSIICVEGRPLWLLIPSTKKSSYAAAITCTCVNKNKTLSHVLA